MHPGPPPYLPDDVSTATEQQLKAAVLYIILNRLTNESHLISGHSVGHLFREYNRRGINQRPIRVQKEA